MANFSDSIKQGVGRALGVAIVVGAIGLVVGGPAGAVAGFKIGAGAGALGGGN